MELVRPKRFIFLFPTISMTSSQERVDDLSPGMMRKSLTTKVNLFVKVQMASFTYGADRSLSTFGRIRNACEAATPTAGSIRVIHLFRTRKVIMCIAVAATICLRLVELGVRRLKLKRY